MSVVSISELQRALQNQRLDVEIMRCIARMRSLNVSNIADALDIDRKSVRYHLYKLKAEGCARDRWIRSRTAIGFPILCHEWQLTQRGCRLLHDGGLAFQIPVLGNLSFARKSPLCARMDRAAIRGLSKTAQTRPGRTHDRVDVSIE